MHVVYHAILGSRNKKYLWGFHYKSLVLNEQDIPVKGLVGQAGNVLLTWVLLIYSLMYLHMYRNNNSQIKLKDTC